MFNRGSLCAIWGERCIEQLLSPVLSMVLMFLHAKVNPFPPIEEGAFPLIFLSDRLFEKTPVEHSLPTAPCKMSVG